MTIETSTTAHFFKRRNPVYERKGLICVDRKKENLYIRSQHRQLHRLAEHCNYIYIVHDEMIRYRIIVNLRDSNLSEKLQTDPELTIDKAVTMAL